MSVWLCSAGQQQGEGQHTELAHQISEHGWGCRGMRADCSEHGWGCRGMRAIQGRRSGKATPSPSAARTLLMRRSALAQLLHSTTPNALSQSDRKVREGQRLQPPCASSPKSGGSPSPHAAAAAGAAGRCTRACCCGGAGCVPRCAAACGQLLAEAKRGGRASLGSGRKPPSIPGRSGGCDASR